MWLLLLDQLRRSPALYLGAVAFVAFIWALPPDTVFERWVVAWSLAVAYFTGALRSFNIISRKDLRLLPVSWRDRWRAQWILAVVIPLTVIAVGQLLGAAVVAVAGLPQGTVDAFVLSILSSAAYLGFATGVWSTNHRQGPPKPPTFKPRSRWLAKLAIAVVFAEFVLVFIGGLSGAIFYRFIPVEITALQGIFGGVVAAGIGTGVWTWFFWSGLGPLHFFRVQPLSSIQSTDSTPLLLEPRGFVGAWRLFEFGLTKACKRALLVAALAFPFLFLIENRDVVKLCWGMLMFVAASLDLSGLRSLRPLPISIFTLNLAMLSRIVTKWVLTLLLMAGASFIAPSRFDGIPILPVFSVVIAVNTVGESLALCFSGRSPKASLIILLAGFIVPRLVPKAVWNAVPTPSHEQVVVLSLLAIGIAFLVNHRTLTRSSTVYKPRTALPSPFGAPQTS